MQNFSLLILLYLYSHTNTIFACTSKFVPQLTHETFFARSCFSIRPLAFITSFDFLLLHLKFQRGVMIWIYDHNFCTGRGICTAQGLAECFHCSCILPESIHLIEGNAGDYACCPLHLICWIPVFNSQSRKSIFLLQFVKLVLLIKSQLFMSYVC